MRVWAAFLLVSLLAGGCGGAQEGVNLAGEWPEEPGDYREVTQEWTRYGELYAGFDEHKVQILELYATVKSPAWRAAYVEFVSERQMLPRAEQAALIEEQRTEAAEHYEVELFVSTFDREANDLQKGDRSAWRLALVNDRGEEVEPVEIERDRRPPSVIRAEFPHYSDFHTAYVARFPKDIDIFGPDAGRFSLKMASQRGGVELAWRAR